jgi:uncharacterized protein YciI
MRQWLVRAWHGKEEEPLDRRMAVRSIHSVPSILLAREWKRLGQFGFRRALLDSQGRMMGSAMAVQFEWEDDPQAWLSHKPCLIQRVLVRFGNHPFRAAEIL